MDAATNFSAETIPTAADRIKAVRAAITAALVTMGRKVDEAARVDGVLTYLEVFEQRRQGGYSFRSNGNGRLGVNIGCIDRRYFPEPKAGYDIAKIAGEVAAYVDRQVAEAEARQALREKEEATDTIVDRLNEDPALDVSGARAYTNRHGQLCVEVDRRCTEEQARALMAAAKAIFGGES